VLTRATTQVVAKKWDEIVGVLQGETVPKIKGNASYETREIDRWVIHSSLRNGAREQDGEARIVQPAGGGRKRGEGRRKEAAFCAR
jgi:hypothetical protein